MEMAKAKIRFDLPIQLGYNILQLVKYRMLQFRYDCLEEYYDMKDFEYLEMDTDSAYLSLASKGLEDMVKPEQETTALLQEDGTVLWFPVHIRGRILSSRMLQKHRAYDKISPGLFKVEAEGKAMIALFSKTYFLKKKTLRQSEIQL